MSIKNESKFKGPILTAIREQLEHRATWEYLLTDECYKRCGVDSSEYAGDAIKRCGLYQGELLKKKGKKGNSLKGLKKSLFSIFAQLVFEMKIKKCDDDHLYIDFHYCPLVKAWQKQGCSDEEIAKLCDQAMCGDRGIGECFGCHLDMPQRIAYGDPICKIRYHRDPNEKTDD